MKNDSLASYMMIDKKYAEVGSKFYFNKTPECKKCLYKEICLKNKADGLLYEIIEVRRPVKKAFCKITGGEAYLAKVKPANLLIALPTKDTLTGVEILYIPVNCGENRCPYISFCSKNSLAKLSKNVFIRVIKRIRRVDCPYNMDLTLTEVEVTRLSP